MTKSYKKETFKKIQNDNKLLGNKLEQIQNEASKYSRIKVQVAKMYTIINSIQITTQEYANAVEENHIRKLNQEDTANIMKGNNVIKILYRHPNLESRYLKSRVHLTKYTNTITIKAHGICSLWKHNVPQRIVLGWIDPSTF